jgi:hypothetical protein
MFFLKLKSRLAVSIATACAMCSIHANAQQRPLGPEDADPQIFDFDLSAGAGWTDNVTRVPVDAEEATLAVAGLRMAFDERRPRFDASLDASLQFYHYFDNEFEDDLLGGFAGDLTFQIAPERFQWVFENNFGQVRTDPFEAATPDNREDFNYLTTGPDFSVRLGSATLLRLSGRYSDTRYEEAEALDGNRATAELSLVRESSPGRGVSFNVLSERVEFEGTGGSTEYDRHQAFVRLEGTGSRTQFGLDLGYTILDDGIEDSDGTLARLSLTRTMSTRSSITLGAGTQFSDAGDLFRDMQNRSGPDLDGTRVLTTQDPFESTFGYASWDFSFNRTSFGAGVDYSREEYENAVDLNRDLTTYGLYIERQLTERLQVRLAGQFVQEEFLNIEFEDDEVQLSAGLSLQMSRTLSVQLQYERDKREAVDERVGATTASDFEENRATLLFVWAPSAGR